MHDFWNEFSKAVEQTRELKITDVHQRAGRAISATAFLPRPHRRRFRSRVSAPACGMRAGWA